MALDNNVIRVRQCLQRLDGSLCLVETKTKSFTATLATPPGLTAILARHRIQQQAERRALGADWPGLDLVFTSTTGTALEPRNVSRNGTASATEPGYRTYECTICGTSLTALGVPPPPRVVMEMLRHSRIGITMNTYAHVAPLPSARQQTP